MGPSLILHVTALQGQTFASKDGTILEIVAFRDSLQTASFFLTLFLT